MAGSQVTLIEASLLDRAVRVGGLGGTALTTPVLLQEVVSRRVLGCHGGLPLADLSLRSLLHVEVP